ncbi:MAG: hypothetical protein ACTHML_09480 [Ginsengibacter sp.]
MEIKNVENRAIILEIAVSIEDMLSLLLSIILQIKNRDESKSLSTKSSGLSFNAKVNLLLDMDYIEKAHIWKFQKFMELRNQFAHNSKVTNFEKCYQLIGGKEKLLSEYPVDKSIPLEIRLKSASISLGFEIFDICKKIVQKIGENYKSLKLLETLACVSISLLNTLKEISAGRSEKERSEEFLKKLIEVIPKEFEKIRDATPEYKNILFQSVFEGQGFPELFKTVEIKDFFSDKELSDYMIQVKDTS